MNKYYISSIHDNYEESFSSSDGEFCNSWEQKRIVKANNLQEALKIYFDSELYYSFNINDLDIQKDNIFTSLLVDIDNCEASDYEIEQWKKDELTLYHQHICISVEIMQEINIEEEFLTVN